MKSTQLIILIQGKYKGTHITTQGLEELGKDLCRTILAYKDLSLLPELKDMPQFSLG